ncbi:MAG: GNAT family N-acetyltransferase [Spirochaetales bacterium]|nr:GNAT family N-acetyltransferase [Spirochaetales bacterium]
MIRKAVKADLEAILAIVDEVKKLMGAEGNRQWNDSYPLYEDFLEDVAGEVLFVDEEDGRGLRGFFCLNEIQPPEYGDVPWEDEGEVLVIHRLAVNPAFHRKGVARNMMAFAGDYARERGIGAIRSDTNSRNKGMIALFDRAGYQFRGTINFPFPEEDFYCFEGKISLT